MFKGRYQVGENLGSGGYGSVHKCTDRLGNRFACKIVKQNHVSRYVREVTVLKHLTSNYRIPRLHSEFIDDGDCCLVTDLYRGGTVIDRIGSKVYSENTVKSIARGALRCLKVCHDNRVVHGDVKPSNLMFSDDSYDATLNLIDYGNSVILTPDDTFIHTGSIEGTTWYMAPEQLNRRVYYQSDIWGLGVTVYQLLTGKMPFNDIENPLRPRINVVFKSIFDCNPKMEGKRWEGMSELSKDFVMEMLKRDPLDRPSVEELLSHPWLEGNVGSRHIGPQFEDNKLNSIIKYSNTSAADANTKRKLDL